MPHNYWANLGLALQRYCEAWQWQKEMSSLQTWRTVRQPFPSSTSLSPNRQTQSLGFRGAQKVFHHNAPISLTLTRPHSTQLLTKAESSMAESASSYVNPACAEIIVVRHGETEWNADGRIQGHLDVELNDAGRQQAAAVADRLSKEPKISVVYSSDLKRALETAQIIATSCGEIEVVKDPELRERHLGDLQGLVFREAATTCPKAYEALSSQKTDQEIPGGGESLDQLYQRCTSSLQKIGHKHKGERVVVVTHGGVIRTLYRWACPNKRSGKVLNTSINVFRLSGDKWTVKTWNDVSHLNQTGYLKSGFGGDRTSG